VAAGLAAWKGFRWTSVKQLGPQTEAATRRGPGLLRVVRGQHALRRWAIVSLIMNIVIVVTGGLVRLTGSGLGCPTWPRCTADSYVSHPELGIHGAIEFGNRLLTFVLIIVALLTLVSALLYREKRPTAA
jgi:cytochrome c oxidase assembly protein subunit 15